MPMFRSFIARLLLYCVAAAGFCTFVALQAAFGEPSELAEGEQFFKQLDAKQAEALEEKVSSIYKSVSPSVVRIFPTGDAARGWFSGVIVSRSGEIFTCAHYNLPPESKVVVELADGRRTGATTLGLVKNPAAGRTHYRAHDVAMLQLDEQREWPAVELGQPSDLENGAFCLSIGSPHGHLPGQPPLLRLGRVLPPRDYGTVRASCRIAVGDSGGPLFDLEGRVLGVLSGNNSWKWAGCTYASVDVFQRFRQRLRAGEEIEAVKPHLGRPLPSPHDAFGAFEPQADLAAAATSARKSAVEVLGDGRPVALGVIVDAEGWIVSKRTEVVGYQKLLCRLVDGRKLEARIAGGSAEHDVALLKVDAHDLHPAQWASDETVRAGQLVASIGPDAASLHFGVIATASAKNPPIKGQLPINGLEKTPQGETGIAFVSVWDRRPDVGSLREMLKQGDFIVKLDESPTPTVELFVKARNARLERADALIGERISLTVRRGTVTRLVYAPLISEANVSELQWKQSPLSLRRNGFPDVFSHDGCVAPDQCGGPVVHRTGGVLGINIARADEVQSFVVPARVLKKIVAELKAKSDLK
jgi:serine protease Do